MKDLEVKIRVNAPCECTEDELIEWVKFCVGYTSSMSLDNPCSDFSLETESFIY
jgi:hypothetical protein